MNEFKLSDRIRSGTDIMQRIVGGQRPALIELAEEVAALEAKLEAMPRVKISDGDAWLVFPDTMISIEGICKFGAPGPIVKRNLRKWRDNTLAAIREEN